MTASSCGSGKPPRHRDRERGAQRAGEQVRVDGLLAPVEPEAPLQREHGVARVLERERGRPAEVARQRHEHEHHPQSFRTARRPRYFLTGLAFFAAAYSSTTPSRAASSRAAVVAASLAARTRACSRGSRPTATRHSRASAVTGAPHAVDVRHHVLVLVVDVAERLDERRLGFGDDECRPRVVGHDAELPGPRARRRRVRAAARLGEWQRAGQVRVEVVDRQPEALREPLAREPAPRLVLPALDPREVLLADLAAGPVRERLLRQPEGLPQRFHAVVHVHRTIVVGVEHEHHRLLEYNT
jgi:hypothetical protein